MSVKLIESYRVTGLLGRAPVMPEGPPSRSSIAAQTEEG